MVFMNFLYRLSQKKVECSICVTLIFKNIAYFDFVRFDTLSSEKNDTKIIWFGLVVSILQPFLKTQSFTNFFKSVWATYDGYSSPQVLSLFSLHGSMGFQATAYGSQKSHYPWLTCHKNEEKKFDKDDMKTTRPISMILVSFFSKDNVLSDEVKICYIF